MAEGRTGHTATLLPNGEVLVATGGTASAELYDPETGTWMTTGSLSRYRSGSTSTLLPNGEVLITSGVDREGQALVSAELYHPASGIWTETASMSTGRNGGTAT